MTVARIERAKYEALLDDFISQLQPANISTWNIMVEAWEKDPSKPDPYFIPPSGMFEVFSRD